MMQSMQLSLPLGKYEGETYAPGPCEFELTLSTAERYEKQDYGIGAILTRRMTITGVTYEGTRRVTAGEGLQ